MRHVMGIVKYLHSVRQVGCAQGQIYFSMENIASTIKAIPGIISINLIQIAIWSMETFIREKFMIPQAERGLPSQIR